MENLLKEAQTLLRLGYIPLSIPLGAKAAKQAGWTTIQPTEETVVREFARCSNLGVRCGDLMADGTRLMALDVDVDNAEIIRCVEQAIGLIVPTKRGKKGATLFVRVDYEQKTTKLKLRRDGAKTAVIDVLCIGAQTVVPPSVHPETMLPYSWIAGQPLYEVDCRTLPVFGPSLVDEIRG